MPADRVSGTLLAPSIEAACERWGPRPALTHRGRTLTYGELWERILALAWAYRSLGVEPGDRVVCQLPACPEHFIALGAAWACGAIHVGAHRDSTAAELAALVGRTQAAAVVFQPPPGPAGPGAALRAVRAAHPATVSILHGHPPVQGAHQLSDLLALPAPGPDPPAPGGAEDTALLLLTSGTTGRPKAVMETLPALWAKMAFFAAAISPGPDDVQLMYLPVNHVFGLKLSLMALASGGRLVLLDQFAPDQALQLVEDERVTLLPGTPTHLTLLLRALGAGCQRAQSVRWAVSAAAPIPREVIEGLYEGLGAELLHVYGCSEGFLTLSTDRHEIRLGSVGRTVFRGPEGTPPDGSVAILDPGRDTRLPPAEVGEIAFGASGPVRDTRLPPAEVGEIAFGASGPVRYWEGPAVGAGGWYRTGDLGWLDRDGRLFVTGRLSEVVNRGGLKVSCGELEAALARFPGVTDCAVVPTPDAILGEAICACVVAPGGPPDLTDVRAHLAETLARHKLPDELCVLESIPRSPVGKIDRSALGALVVDADQPRVRIRRRASTPA